METTNNTNCGQNCASCQVGTTTATCVLCVPGSTLVNGQCVLCPVGCSLCSSATISNCLACSPGNYLDLVTGTTCIACSANCQSCNPNGCTVCVNNYTLTSTFTCVPKCWYPCATCSSTSPSTCTSCVAGYTFSATATASGNCVSTTSCNAQNNCVVCPFGWSLQYTAANATNPFGSQNCVQCAAASNCARCNPASVAQCTSCRFGLYLTNSSTCVACPTGCTNCLNKNTCMSCGVGYVAQMAATIAISANGNKGQSSNAPFQLTYQPVTCLACSSPCMTCYNTPSTCMSCVSGYTFMNNLCVSNFNFAIQVVLTPSTNSAFAGQFYSFLTSVAQAAGQSISTIAVTSLVYGSVTVNAQISTTNAPGSAAANTQQTNINNAITSPTLGGMTVKSSTLTLIGVPTPTPTPDDNSSGLSDNTILIIAIVVPIGSISTYFAI